MKQGVMMKHRWTGLLRMGSSINVLIPLIGFLWVLHPAVDVQAQRNAVGPELNRAFQNPDVDDFVERFERESRDVYAKRKEVLAALALRKGQAVADIGAGTGFYSRLFAREVGPTGRVYAVDIAKKFVDHIVQTSRRENLDQVRGVVCGPDSVGLPEHSIDVAFICDTYHHFEYPEQVTRSIWRALRPGGVLYLIDFERIEGVSSEWTLKHVRGGEEQFTKEIESVGFKRVARFDLFETKYFLKFQKTAAPRDN